MIARPEISRSEREPTELGAFEVGNVAPVSRPGRSEARRLDAVAFAAPRSAVPVSSSRARRWAPAAAKRAAPTTPNLAFLHRLRAAAPASSAAAVSSRRASASSRGAPARSAAAARSARSSPTAASQSAASCSFPGIVSREAMGARRSAAWSSRAES